MKGFGDAYGCTAAHAAYCTDMTLEERFAAQYGPSYWFQAFPYRPEHFAALGAVPPSYQPNMSVWSKPGHRWAWLVRAVGWDRFAQIAMLPDAERQAVLAKARNAALDAVRRATAPAQPSPDAAMVASSGPNAAGLAGLIYGT